jgi:hypothetical protein
MLPPPPLSFGAKTLAPSHPPPSRRRHPLLIPYFFLPCKPSEQPHRTAMAPPILTTPLQVEGTTSSTASSSSTVCKESSRDATNHRRRPPWTSSAPSEHTTAVLVSSHTPQTSSTVYARPGSLFHRGARNFPRRSPLQQAFVDPLCPTPPPLGPHR